MYLRTQVLTAMTALLNLLDDLLVTHTAGTIFDNTSTVRLYTAGPAPQRSNVLGSFTEPTFTGYAPVVVATVTGPINLPGGQGVTKSCLFEASAAVSPTQSALGMIVVAGDGTTLLAQEQFTAPAVFQNAGDALIYDLILAPRTGWGGEADAA